MGSLKLQSFEDFANASAEAAKMKLEEEQKAARTESAYQFETLLSDFGVTSVKDLSEEDRNKFFAKLGASEVSESLAIIEEGTRSQIGIISKSGKIESVYMHYDGYPDHMLPTIKKGYMNPGTVKMLLKKGGGSFLEADPSKINFYGDKTTMKGDVKKIDDYIYDASDKAGAEFVYLYDMGSKKWMMADTYDEPRELKPAFEKFKINEAFVPSKGNVKDAKKVSKALEGIMVEGSALTADSATHLGAIKYLTMNALEDANFHSYIEPIGKKIGGKIRTVMSKIDGIGGIEIPVGAKTIKKFLDEHYSTLSSAAGWSGIGIVEGVAMYLDGWGFSKVAQAIVDEFNLLFQNESVLTEGNAFLAARAKAIEEDAEEFEFNGKTYPVIKEDVDAICEATVEMDAINPDDKDFLKFLKKNRVKIINKVMDGPGGGTPVITMQGKRKDLETVLADPELGWDDPDLAEYIEEGIKTENEEITEDEIEIKVDGDYEIEVEKEGGEEEESEEAPAEEVEETEEVTEGMHPKIKKAMKAVEKGETVYGENIRFPGRFKIIEIDKGGFATVDYMDGTDPMQMAAMNIAIDSLSFESVTNEAEVKSDEDFKEYAFSVLGQAFGDKFDEEKAQEVVDGLLDKHGDDYGAAVGALQSSLG